MSVMAISRQPSQATLFVSPAELGVNHINIDNAGWSGQLL
jgi:hypothetical protein